MLKRIISRNYPASRLPASVRAGFDPGERVQIIVEEEGPEGSEFETIEHNFVLLPHAEEAPPEPPSSLERSER